MKYAVWGLIVLLIVVHQDVWFWDDRTLLFGVLPITLAFHVGISLASAFAWYLATVYCWPDVEASARTPDQPPGETPGGAPGEPA